MLALLGVLYCGEVYTLIVV